MSVKMCEMGGQTLLSKGFVQEKTVKKKLNTEENSILSTSLFRVFLGGKYAK